GLQGAVGESTLGALFISLPGGFAEMGSVGRVVGLFFFTALLFGALTSTVSLLEVVVASMVDETKMQRPLAALVAGGLITLVGLWSALDTNALGFLDAVANNVMLPLGGLVIAMGVAWKMPDARAQGSGAPSRAAPGGWGGGGRKWAWGEGGRRPGPGVRGHIPARREAAGRMALDAAHRRAAVADHRAVRNDSSSHRSGARAVQRQLIESRAPTGAAVNDSGQKFWAADHTWGPPPVIPRTRRAVSPLRSAGIPPVSRGNPASRSRRAGARVAPRGPVRFPSPAGTGRAPGSRYAGRRAGSLPARGRCPDPGGRRGVQPGPRGTTRRVHAARQATAQPRVDQRMWRGRGDPQPCAPGL